MNNEENNQQKRNLYDNNNIQELSEQDIINSHETEDKQSGVIDLNFISTEKTDERQQEVEFEFYDPSESQFHAIKMILVRYLTSISNESSELADSIIANCGLGTLIGTADDHFYDEDSMVLENKDKNIASVPKHIYALCTILHVNTYISKKFMQNIMDVILDCASHYAPMKHDIFANYFIRPKLGLLINERYLNLPSPQIPLLHNQILEDQNWAITNDSKYAHEYIFDHLLYVSKVQLPIVNPPQESNTKKSKKKKLKQNFGVNSLEDLQFIFYNQEDEYLMKNSLTWFYTEDRKEFQRKDDTTVIIGRIFMIIKFDAYVNMIKQQG